MKKYLFILPFLLVPFVANAAITFDASSTVTVNGVSTASTSITVGSGSNEALFAVFAGACNCSTPPTGSMAFSGGTMTVLTNFTSTNALDTSLVAYEITGLSAGTYHATMTFPGHATNGGFIVASYFGVNQTTPVEATTSFATSNHVTIGTGTITTLTANDYLMDFVQNEKGASNTPAAPQVAIGSTFLGNTTSRGGASYYAATSTQTYTTSWTFSTSSEYGIGELAIVPAVSKGATAAISQTMASIGNCILNDDSTITVKGTLTVQ